MKFYIGDLVGIGKGKVQYQVDSEPAVDNGTVYIISENTGKGQWIDPERLVLLDAGLARELAEEATEQEADEQAAQARLEITEKEVGDQVREYSGLTEFTVEGHEHQESEYGRSILKGLQTKVNLFLGGLSPASKTKRQKRRAKNKVAKASRKANR